jgi:multimeric flavodoxin WrbA
MDLVIHDIKDPAEKALIKIDPNNATVISDNGKIHPCICCFGCWIKTPGQCVINDGYNAMGALISKCNQIIIVSRCFYGSYSPFVHNVLDRSISYLLPYFRTKDGETHHKNRYDHAIAFTAHFYGRVSDRERETARKLVAANGVNFFAQKTETYFYDTIADLPEVLG